MKSVVLLLALLINAFVFAQSDSTDDLLKQLEMQLMNGQERLDLKL